MHSQLRYVIRSYLFRNTRFVLGKGPTLTEDILREGELDW